MTLPITPIEFFDLKPLIADVKSYAIANYSKGEGWDIVVEAYTDDEIAEVIRGSKTKMGALRKMSREIRPKHEHRDEMMAIARQEMELS